MDPDWNADFHFRPYDIFIEDFTASRHVSDGLTKMVSPRAAAFLKHDDAARSVLRDSAAAFRSRRCRCGLPETCAQAKGAAIARAILSNIFFICVFPILHGLIGRGAFCGCHNRTYDLGSVPRIAVTIQEKWTVKVLVYLERG